MIFTLKFSFLRYTYEGNSVAGDATKILLPLNMRYFSFYYEKLNKNSNGRNESNTLASKKDLAPPTPTCPTSTSVNFANFPSPLSSCSSPAFAFRKINRNCGNKT